MVLKAERTLRTPHFKANHPIATMFQEWRSIFAAHGMSVALIYLEGFTNYPERDHMQTLGLKACLNDAKNLFSSSDLSENWMHGLRIAEYSYKAGKIAQADMLFTKVLEFARGLEKTPENNFTLDAIMVAAAMTYGEIGETNKAFEVAEEIWDLTSRFSAFSNLARNLISGDRKPEAIKALELAAASARLNPINDKRARSAKMTQMLIVVKSMITLDTLKARAILEEMRDELVGIRRQGMLAFLNNESDRNAFEKVAILLLQTGEGKEVLIDLLMEGQFSREWLKAATPEQIKQGKIDDLPIAWPKFAKAAGIK